MTAHPLPDDPRWTEVPLYTGDDLARLRAISAREAERERARLAGAKHARESAPAQGKSEKIEMVEVELPWQ